MGVPQLTVGQIPPGQTDTVQYLCLHPLGPAAEMLRHNVGPTGDPDEVVLNLWTAQLDLDDVARVDFDDCARYGCSPDELVGDDYTPTQSLADRLRAVGRVASSRRRLPCPGRTT